MICSLVVALSLAAMLTITRSDVPVYLQSGSFFHSLVEGEAESDAISVPVDALKPDLTVTSDDELVHLLSSLRFWGVDSLPLSTIAPFIFEGTHDVSKLSPFYENFPTLRVLTSVSGCEAGPKIRTAIAYGATDLVIYLDEHENSWPNDASELAAVNGRLDILQYIHRTKPGGLSELTADWSVEGGQAACLKFAYENDGRGPYDSDHVADSARNGHVACLEYLHSLGLVADRSDLCAEAAKFGQTESIVYLRSIGCAWDDKATRNAAGGGHLVCLKYLVRNGCAWNSDSWFHALYGGELEVLKYLRGLDYAWDEKSTMRAAHNGQLECLAYLHEQGCPWDASAAKAAAHNGHLHILTYLHEHGCPWETETCLEAIDCGRAECVRYLVAQGCPITKQQGLDQVLKAREYYSGRNGAACDVCEELFNALVE